MQGNTKTLNRSFFIGLLLAFAIAVAAALLANLPFLEVVGPLVLAILIGMVINHFVNVKKEYRSGLEFSSKKLLRAGIILLGLRLHLGDLYGAGVGAFLYAGILLVAAMGLVYGLARLLKVDRTVSLLAACGTAICGAAAIVALAPLMKAKGNQVALSVAVIAVMGTLFTIAYTLLQPVLPLSSQQYGFFTGGTLHEIAHAVAASQAGGKEAEDMAIIVKLTRVALLVPVAVLIGLYAARQESTGLSLERLPIPWFIFGFLAMGFVNTASLLPDAIVDLLLSLSYLLLGMAMAGLGLNATLSIFKKSGKSLFYAVFLGSLLLALLGYGLIFVLGLG
ncbi:putative sulfate exporter family transporter [Bacillus sp. JCM 19041]|uniref:YeiH family protein n=1 Tax=Bacillus sp. JCM 19041 TaxID=1460637 RepID=UPI0006D1FF2A